MGADDRTDRTEIVERSNRFVSLCSLEDRGGDRFVGPVGPDRSFRVFGGQFLAQALIAARRTVERDVATHSLHAYFLRAGDADAPTEFEVERVRDGRSFGVRQVTAHQDGKELFRMTMSLHAPEDGLGYQPRPAGVVDALAGPPPDDVELTYTAFTEAVVDDGAPWPGGDRPMDIRYINPPEGRAGPPVTEPQRMWMRIDERLPDEAAVHEAGLAYLADSTLVDHVALPHGKRWQDSRLTGASLDHAMWFHRPARADRWLLYDQRVEFTGRGRGLATGRFYDRDGALVATCAQEGLLRWAE